ncbi:unnamed protein product [Adineta steineri]|uniref:Uncharacterized protein n=1 Tax=Adineta steineri TaxID=433720 RepID=A0A816BTP5_9BILA|nr:unnamed protein product [Adineta steineri]
MNNITTESIDASELVVNPTGEEDLSFSGPVEIIPQPKEEYSNDEVGSKTFPPPYTLAEAVTSTISPPEDEMANLFIQRPVDLVEQNAVQKEQVSLINQDEIKNTYRMHLATVPGNMGNKFELGKAQRTQCDLVQNITKFLDCEKNQMCSVR